jgi:predicted MFS family arabinose efflux permease
MDSFAASRSASTRRATRGLAWQSALGTIAQLTQGIVGLSLLLVGHESGLAVTTSAFAVAGFSVGIAIGRPLQGRLLDVAEPRMVVAACGVAHGLAYVGIAVAGHERWAGAYVLFGFLAGATVPPIATHMRAAWPARFQHATRAFALIAMLQTVSILIAPLLFTVVDTVASAITAMLTVAGASALGTVLFAIAIGREERLAARAARVSPRRYALPLLATALLGAVNGAAAIAAPAIAIAAGHPAVAGLLVAAATLGALVGGLLLMRHPAVPTTSLLIAGSAVEIIGAILVSVPAPLGVTAVGLVLLGAGFAPALASAAVTISSRAAGTAESFGWQSTALGIGEASGSAVAGQLVRFGAHLSALPAIVCASVCLLIGLGATRAARSVPSSRGQQHTDHDQHTREDQ